MDEFCRRLVPDRLVGKEAGVYLVWRTPLQMAWNEKDQ